MQDLILFTETTRGPFFNEEDARQGIPDGAEIIQVEVKDKFNLEEKAKEWGREPSQDMTRNVDSDGMLTVYWVTFEVITAFEDE